MAEYNGQSFVVDNRPGAGSLNRKNVAAVGIIWPHEPVIKTEIGTGKFMLRTTLASSRVLRVCVLGLAAITTAVIFTTDTADARRYLLADPSLGQTPAQRAQLLNSGGLTIKTTVDLDYQRVCIVAIGLLSLRQPGFLRYDARHPTP